MLWNVLTDDQFDGWMIAGSSRVPLDRVLKTARAAALEPATEIVVYGAGGACPQALLAAEKLASAGFARVRLLAEWSAGCARSWPSEAPPCA